MLVYRLFLALSGVIISWRGRKSNCGCGWSKTGLSYNGTKMPNKKGNWKTLSYIKTFYFHTQITDHFCVVITAYSTRVINESRYSRMDQVKFFKGSLPQILLGQFLNTLTQMVCAWKWFSMRTGRFSIELLSRNSQENVSMSLSISWGRNKVSYGTGWDGTGWEMFQNVIKAPNFSRMC